MKIKQCGSRTIGGLQGKILSSSCYGLDDKTLGRGAFKNFFFGVVFFSNHMEDFIVRDFFPLNRSLEYTQEGIKKNLLCRMERISTFSFTKNRSPETYLRYSHFCYMFSSV